MNGASRHTGRAVLRGALGRAPGATLAAALICLVLLGGCAARTEFFSPPAGAGEGVWTFRHAVTLELPDAGLTLSFTGMMRLDAAKREARVIILGGMGLTFLDMTVTETEESVRYMHPSLARLPRAAETAADTVRAVWFGEKIRDGAVRDAAVSAVPAADGWAREVLLSAKRFVLRVTLLDARPDTRPVTHSGTQQ